MDGTRNWWRRLSFFILFISLIAGGFYAYDNFRPAGRGFVSPVVFGDQGSSFSPFSSLLGDKSSGFLASVSDLGKVLGIKTDSSPVTGAPGSAEKSTVDGSNVAPLTNPAAGSLSGLSNIQPAGSNTTSTNTSSNSVSSNSDSSSSSTSVSNSSSNYTSSQQAVEDTSYVVINYLKSGSYSALYNLMGREFKDTFAEADFVGGFVGALTVVSGTVTTAPEINAKNPEWAQQEISLGLVGGSLQRYLNIYHLENSAWTLFGTQDR